MPSRPAMPVFRRLLVPFVLFALVGAMVASAPSARAMPAQAAPAQDAPAPDAPPPDSTPPAVPPDLPVVDPPVDPAAPPPPPPPPIPDPSPQVARVLTQLHILDLQTVLAGAQAAVDRAQVLQDQIQGMVDAATRDRDLKRRALTDAATTAYVRGGVDAVGDQAAAGSPGAFVSTESARMLAGSAIDTAHDRVVAAENRLARVQAALEDARQQTAVAIATRDTVQQQIDEANAGLGKPDPSGDLSPTVLGDSTLTAAEIAGWYQDEHVAGWAGTVDLNTMVGYYVDEGRAEDVRGDVAFAQSMVETGAFTSPLTGHNNFAGIGACDSCPTGFDFDTAQLGVRAQVQLLHAYADRTLRLIDLKNPAVGSNPDRLSVRGCCTTWNKLTGTWATDPNYGPKIMTIYLSMLQYAYAKRLAAPPPVP